jgi:putative ABC transport system permease protein
MVKNYFKTAWRNIIRNKTTTLINLFGLSVALGAFIFIALWVQNELNFDNYHHNARDIYLVQTKDNPSGNANSITPFPLANALKENHDVAYTARMSWWGGTLNVNGELFDLGKSGAAVDSYWFNIFHYDVVSGDLNSFNRNPFSIIFTETKAKQLFGNKNPIDQTVKLDGTLYQVKAIVKDNPINSSLQFDMLVPMAARMTQRQSDLNNWNNSSYRSFVKFHPHTNIGSFIKSATTQLQKASGNTGLIALEPLRELHFDAKSDDPVFRRGSHTAVFIFSALALLLLITASINYVNLTIAKANARSKEISIRKIVGGSRAQLFFQFLVESFLLCLMVLFISLLIMQLALPAFNNLTESKFELSAASASLWRILLGTLVFTTLLNGVFPALTMSVFKPLNYLQGHTILKFRNVLVRKGLVVFQFVTGIAFIIGTVVIYRQMHLAQTSSAQYNRAQVVSFRLPYQLLQKMDYDQQKTDLFSQTFKIKLQQNSAIETIALASSSIEEDMNSGSAGNWYWQGRDTSINAMVARLFVTPEAKSIFNFQMKEGRWFNNDHSDKKNYILNETAVKELGIQPPVIGKLFARNGGDTGQIIGVIKDYNFSSLYNKIGPMVIANNNGDELEAAFFVKIAPGNIPKAMDAIAATWKEFIPDAPFSYEFMNEAFDNLYKDDLKISKLALWFSCISVIISALGLFGLAAFVAEQKRKEIGIRKVLGASVMQITSMLSKAFIKLVVIAMFIASPIAWWLMNKWLQSFTYRIHISWWMFALAGFLTIAIALLTVSFQTIKAAIANPVKSLRTE